MTAETDRLIGAYLRSGEQLRWSGRPRQGFVFRPTELLLTPFTLFYAMFVLHQILKKLYFSDTAASASLTAVVGLAAMSLLGYLVVGRFFADRFYRSKLVYGVTDRRVIIRRDGPYPWVQSIESEFLTNVWLTTLYNRRGSIYFAGEQRRYLATLFAPVHAILGAPAQFFQIEDPQKVYDLIVLSRKR